MSEIESPRKRSKRESRVSKITSTPRHRSDNNGPSRAPSVSTIYKSSPTISSMDDSTQLDIDDDLASITINDRTDSEFADYVKKFQWKGVWSAIKPSNRNSLLYKICQNPHNIRVIISKLIADNRKNIEFILIEIFKLLANASGIEGNEINIQTIRIGDIKTLVQTIERSVNRGSKKHILMKYTEAGRHIYEIFSQFFMQFFEIAYDAKILFQDSFEGYFFEFITCTIKSIIKQVRMPAVIAANSMLTSCLKLYKRLLNSNSNVLDKDKLEKTVDFFYFIFNANCLVPDTDFHTVRLYTIQHLVQWLQLFPEVFINKRKCLNILFKLTKDASTPVRLEAVNGLKRLIETNDLHTYLKSRITEFFNNLSERTNDIGTQITNKSLNILISMLPQYSNHVNIDIKFRIIKIIFQDNTDSAKLAGKFMVKYLKIHHGNSTKFIVALVKITMLRKEFTDLMAMLVEACMDHCDELTNWPLLIDVITNETNSKLKKHIVELLCEMVRYKLTGKFSMNRNNQKCEMSVNIEDNHLNIAKVVLPRLMLLFNIFKDDQICLILISDLLLIIDHEQCKISDLIEDYVGIIKTYIDLFNNKSDKKLFEKICQVLMKFYDFDRTVQEALDIIITDLIDNYNSEMQKLAESSNINVRNNITKLSFKISMLFNCFDLTNFIEWQRIFCFTNDNTLDTLKYLITSSKWYLIWSLRHYLGNNDGSFDYLLLRKNVEDYINICLDIINVNRLSVKAAHLRAFENLTEIYSTIGELLQKDKRKYEQFLVKITDEIQQKQFLDFLENCIVNKKSLSLDCRRQYLANTADMLYQEILPIESFSYIFKYYSTHFDEYHEIIEHMMVELSRTPLNLSLVILDTLAVSYKRILEEHAIVDVNSGQSKLLLALSKKFCLFIRSGKFEDIYMKLLLGAINFTFQSRKHYEFLYFLRCFVDCLNTTQKSQVRKVFLQKLPKEDRRHDIMLVFGNCIKNNN